MLKKITIGAGLAAILATSAMAQSYDPSVGSGNLVPGNNTEYGTTARASGANAFAFERGSTHHQRIHHERMMHRDRDVR